MCKEILNDGNRISAVGEIFGIKQSGKGYGKEEREAKAQEYLDSDAMLETDLQDAFFFFGDAPTTRSPLSMWKKQV